MSQQGQLRKKAARANDDELKLWKGPKRTAPKKPSYNSGRRGSKMRNDKNKST